MSDVHFFGHNTVALHPLSRGGNFSFRDTQQAERFVRAGVVGNRGVDRIASCGFGKKSTGGSGRVSDLQRLAFYFSTVIVTLHVALHIPAISTAFTSRLVG